MGRLSKMWFGRRCSLFRKLGVAAAAARDAVRVLRQEDPSPALRTVLPFPGDPSPIDLVEFSLEPGGALLLLRLGLLLRLLLFLLFLFLVGGLLLFLGRRLLGLRFRFCLRFGFGLRLGLRALGFRRGRLLGSRGRRGFSGFGA